MRKLTKTLIIGLLLSFVFLGVVRSDEITLRVPNRSDGAYDYFEDLIRTALIAAGHVPIIKNAQGFPQKRWIREFENGGFDVITLVESLERNSKYVPVEIGLTNNLIGQRILLIPKGAASDYSTVKNLDDFRALKKTGGFGINWFDVGVWETNNLNFVIIDGEWRVIYDMVASQKRGIDYLSRGATEILGEAKLHPRLEIEPRLILEYDRDVRFYLNKQSAHLKGILEESLNKARQSGLIDKLLKKHYGEIFTRLRFDKRIRLRLKTPK